MGRVIIPGDVIVHAAPAAGLFELGRFGDRIRPGYWHRVHLFLRWFVFHLSRTDRLGSCRSLAGAVFGSEFLEGCFVEFVGLRVKEDETHQRRCLMLREQAKDAV